MPDQGTNAPSRVPTIASDEDMQFGYVLISDAESPDDAERVLREQARDQWGWKLGTVEYRRRQWYRPATASAADEGDLEQCAADDPQRDSEWWLFDLSEEDHEQVIDYGVL